MRCPVLPFDIVNIVGSYGFQVKLLGQPDQMRDKLCLFLNSMIVQLDKIILLPEHIDHLPKCPLGFLLFSPQKELRNPALHTAGKTNQSINVCGECFQVGSWTIVKAINMGIRYNLAEVLIALKIFCQQTKMERFVIFPPWTFVIFMIGYNISFTPDNRFNSPLLSLLNKGNSSKQVTMIGKSHGRHS